MKVLPIIFLLTLRSSPLTSGYMYKYDTSILDGDSDLGISDENFDENSYEIDEAEEDEVSKVVAKPPKTEQFPSTNSLKKVSKRFMALLNSPNYVDKTHFLEMLFENRRRKQMNVITSAKGFGKTTIMDMVKFFAQTEVDPMGTPLKREDMLSYSVFANESSNLNVSRNVALHYSFLGYYPVIYLNFKNLIGNNVKSTWRNLQSRIKKLFIEYNWMVNRINHKYKMKRFDCTVNEKLQHSVMQKIINNKKVKAETLEMSLFIFSEALYMHFKRRVLVLIDDFDDPIVDLALHPQKDFPRDRVLKVLGNMLDRLLVGIDKLKYVDAALLAGTTSVRLSITFNSYGKLFRFNRFLDRHPYANYFAFTEEEVKDLFTWRGLNYKNLEMVKKLHNGYVTADEKEPTSLYCPQSVISFLNQKLNESSSSSSSPLIDNPSLTKFFPLLKYDKIRSMISHLLLSKPINFAITRKMEYEDLDHVKDVMNHNNNKSALDTNALRTFFTYFLDQGYFTTSNKCPDAKTAVFEVANLESLQGLANFFYEYVTNYDAVDLNSTMISFDNIFTTEEVSEEMLIDLRRALRSLYPTGEESDGNKYRMHSLIYCVLLKNYRDGTVEVKINSDPDTETEIRADIFIVDWKYPPKAMVIEIRQDITAKEALKLAEKNLFRWRTKRKLNTIKYLGISFNDGGKVRVGYKDNNLHKTPIIIQKVTRPKE